MKHIPNILSAFRILLIPFIWTSIQSQELLNAAILIVVSGLTDFFDGYLARKNNWITNLGKVLDPAADKLTQVALYILFIKNLNEYWPFFAIMIGKEVIMIVVGGILIKKGATLEGSKWFGKVTTFIFYTVMILLLLFPDLSHGLKIILLSIVTASSVIALILYIPDFLDYLEQIKKEN